MNADDEERRSSKANSGNELSDWWRSEKWREGKSRSGRRTDLTSSSFFFFDRWNSRLTALLVRHLERDYTCRISARARARNRCDNTSSSEQTRVSGECCDRGKKGKILGVENYLGEFRSSVQASWISCEWNTACVSCGVSFSFFLLSPLYHMRISFCR